MKVIVTGGTGFIGRYLVEELKKSHEVITVGRSPQNKIMIDIVDKEYLRKIPGADAIINLAAYVPDGGLSHRETADEAKKCVRANALSTYHLLQHAKKSRMKFIQSSSLAVFGKALALRMNEQTQRKPASAYGLSKHLADCFCELHEATILCYPSVFGCGQRKSVMQAFIEDAQSGKDIVVFGTGQREMDFVYVKDVVQANMKALASPAKGFFVIGSGRVTTMQELAEKVKAVFGTKKTKIIIDAARKEEDIHVSMDIAKAEQQLGYAPKYTLESGLQDYKKMMRGLQ